MNELKFYNIFVVWTRSITLILSIAVVVTSLSVYNYHDNEPFASSSVGQDTLESHKIIYDMIQDRQLIATLVAAQASIFCPLFLLMSSPPPVMHVVVNIWKAGFEQFCQLLMPLGLAFSWIFSITFDKRMEAAMLTDEYRDLIDSTNPTWTSLCVYIADSLKYFIIIALIMEALAIWVASFKYLSLLYISQNQYSIRLTSDDDMECCVEIDLEKREQSLYNN